MQTSTRLLPASSANAPAPSVPPPTATDQRSRRRIYVLAGVFMLLVTWLLIQLLRYQAFPPKVVDVPIAETSDSTTRGLIVDRQGMPLAVNRYFYRLTTTPANLETPAERHEVAQQLLDLIGVPYEQTYAALEAHAGRQYAELADAVTQEQVDRLKQAQAELWETRGPAPLHQVLPAPTTKRFYPQAELTAHLLGFVLPYQGPVFGLEKYYDQYLVRTTARQIGVDLQSFATLPTDVQRFLPSPVGKDLVLTLDAGIQWILRDELQKGLIQYKAEAGTVIVMDPRTGAILGMVSLPDYDPNSYEEGYLPNPAVSEQYEPGSVFKIITVAGALDSGVVTPTMIFNDPGSYTLGDRVFYNSTRMANGDVTVTQALALSLNVVTVQIVERMGADDFYRYVRAFGFAAATSIDLSDEINGAVKTPQDPNWSLADLGANSFGQGIAVTPMQMLNATAAIANGGKLMQPYVVYARVMGDEVQYTQPVVVRQVLEPDSAAQLTDMMVEVVNVGNSKAAVAGYQVAGKSGTAQIPIPGGYDERETIVTFVGYAPADDPQFVMLVKMDRPDPDANQWAGYTAAPVFGSIAKRLLDRLGVPPDSLRLAAVEGD
jgi:cell division protein FtsI/penicillin-binding protein 2